MVKKKLRFIKEHSMEKKSEFRILFFILFKIMVLFLGNLKNKLKEKL